MPILNPFHELAVLVTLDLRNFPYPLSGMRYVHLLGFLCLTSVLGAAPLRVGVSVLPFESVLGQLGGEWVEVQSLQREGDSCSVFEPRPSSITWLAKADVFFRTGVGYESIIMEKIRARFPELTVLDLRDSVSLLSQESHHHHHHDGQGHACSACGSGNEATDPHIWMDPQRLSKIAGFVSAHLAEAIPERADELSALLRTFQEECESVDAQLAESLSPFEGRAFYIYHSALNYFADRYGLRQIAISGSGQSPTARELHRRIQEAREEQITVIFVQPQESRKHAEIIAKAIGARVVEIDPMAQDWKSNLLQIGDALRVAFGG